MLTKKKMFGKLYEKIFTIEEENDLCWVAKKETPLEECAVSQILQNVDRNVLVKEKGTRKVDVCTLRSW